MKKQQKYNYLLGPVAVKISSSPTGKWKNSSPKLDQINCTYCFSCAWFCPANVIEIDNFKKKITIEYDYCKGCGICTNICKNGCIEMLENGK